MLAKSLALVLLVTVTVAEIPSYMKICGRRNPNLDKCVIQSVEGLREKLRAGMPELEVPSLEPLKLSRLPLAMAEALQAHASNVKLYGLSNFDVKSLHINLKEKTIDIDLTFKKVVIDADCDIKAKILVLITGKGPIHIETDNVNARVLLKYKLLKKNGAEHMFVPTMTTKLTLRDYKAHFQPIEDGPDDTLSTAINAAIDGGRQEIIESIVPTIEKVITEEMLRIANKICEHFTYSELFPDIE